jgi:tetratricopeptide (TPR) repeat protein
MASEEGGIELGLRLFAVGRTREAAAALEAALAANAGAGVAWRLLGDIRLVAGDVTAAQAAYDRMLAAVVPDPTLRQPALDLAAGRSADAASALGDRLKRQPGAAPVLHLLGEALLRQGQLAEAETVLTHVLTLAPNLHLARLAYALLLQRLGRHAEAIAELDRLLGRDPRHHRARMAKAASLTELDDYAAAAELTAALLEDFPDQPRGWLVHGNGLRTLGRIEGAVAAYRRCLALDPASGEAWWSLANLKAYRFADDDVATMTALVDATETSPEARSHLHFALGKAREDERRDAEAFAHYTEANAIQGRLRWYDADATTALVRRSQALFTPAFFAERAGWGDPAADPIFIVGLPRSGSTLVDQILASHPVIEGTRELMDIQSMADWAGAQGTDYPSALAGLPRAAIATLGRDYLARTRPHRRLGRPCFTDKAPWNFLHVGLIRLILPNAKIVDVRRHPLGCGLSAFKQHFAGGFDFTHDLTDLGRYYADYVALMAHHDAVLPGHVHRLLYEDLVADTETEVRRLLDYLGLPFDPETLRFFDNPRAVATPSSEQVRRPIFTEGLEQWRRFEPWLGPLKEALGPVLDAYPSPL